MHLIPQTKIPDILLFKPDIFTDNRGLFFESFHADTFSTLIGRHITFVQDNYSVSQENVLRGLHYQFNTPQAKLIQVVKGEIFDVAVDLRQSSPTFGKWVGQILNSENRIQMFIPEGFAHGFLTLSPISEVLYKVSAPYKADDERTLRWDDPILGIEWPLKGIPILSTRDQNGEELHINNCFK